MMNRAEIQELFLLEDNPLLFDTALRPPSCGGGAEFEQLALYGDLVINMHLYDYLISKGRERKGDITSCKVTIHDQPVIKAFADEFLGIPDILTPLDANYQPQDRDLAETVEALIGASFKINGLERCRPIVYSFIEFAIEIQKKLREQNEFDESQNYFGELMELFRNPDLSKSPVILKKSDIEPIREEYGDGSHTYRFEGKITFNEVEYEISTHYWKKKDEARNEAAFLVRCDIEGKDPKYTKYDPARSKPPLQEKAVQPTESIDSEELIFRKPDLQNELIKVSHNKDEFLVDWVKRKAQKDPWRMLILLSARLDTVSVASWTCGISSDVLAIINLQLEEHKYFAFGFGPSKTKARKAAGKKMLMEVNLTEWIDKCYPNQTI